MSEEKQEKAPDFNENEQEELEVLEGEIVEEIPPEEPETEEAEATEDEERSEEEKKETTDLEAELAEAQAQAAKYLDGWQRCQANFDNYRKRVETDKIAWRSTANAALLSRLLPVLDDFARAFESLPEALEDHPWLDGIRLIRRKIESILEAENVKPIEVSPGDPFDPQYHQAVLYQELEEVEEGHIIAVTEKGYMLGKRVLRPTSVVVAKAPPPPPEPEAPEAAPEEQDDVEPVDEEAADATSETEA